MGMQLHPLFFESLNIKIMEYAIMAVIAVLGYAINAAVTSQQQNKEFSQQENLLNKEQEFSAEREDIAWQRSRPQQMFSDYLDTGFNANLAAQAVLGGNAETASTSGSPAAPTTNSAIGALQSMFGQSQDELYNALRNVAEIKNIEANTDKTEVETGILPRDYALRAMSVDAQIKVWNKSVDEMASRIKLNDEQTELVRQQNLYYGRLTESEIKLRQEQVNKAIAEAKLAMQKIEESKAAERNLDADTALKHAETDKIYQAEIPNIQADTNLKDAQTSTEWNRNAREGIARDFENALGGVPLTADAHKYVMKLANEGKYDEISQFYQVVFTSSLSQSVGNTLGMPNKKIGAPMKLFEYTNQGNGLNALMNNPYWNPQLRTN